jgi:hypothetical protein
MDSKNLSDEFGRTIRPQELAEFLDIDVRTVKKYAYLWGGVFVTRTDVRFFEKKVMEVIENANAHNETWKEAMERRSLRRPLPHGKDISGQHKAVQTGSDSLGRKNTGGIEKSKDRHGVFASCNNR